MAWARATGGALDCRARFEQLRQAVKPNPLNR
jgi:hypothetical protein